VLLAVDARSMARSAAALVSGFTGFDADLAFAGVVFNRIGGPRHLAYILEALEGRDLVVAGTESVLSGEREYRFKHALVRDVAYNTLARRDRSELHRAVVDWLGAGAEESPREIIALEAHHLALAYDGLRGALGDDAEVDALRERAFRTLLEASASARQRVALGQARHFAREARRFAGSAVEASLAAEALGEAHFFAYQGDSAWRTLRDAIDLRLDEAEGIDPEIARLCARALLIPVRWGGSMQTRPDEVTVLRYLYLGMDHAAPRSEDSVRLLILKGFWQHAFPRADEDRGSFLITPEESLRSGEQAVGAAVAMGRPDLGSAALDAVTGYYVAPGLYSAARPHTRRRLELIGQINDLWEVGDTFAMQGWVGFHLGEYREAERRSDEGYQLTVSQAPSLALQCLRWRAMARFRLGDWDGVRRDLALARDLLGEDREDPADYVSPMFAVAALVHEYRGEHVVAESVLDVLSGHYERRAIDDRDPLPLSQWAEFVAPILIRRGRKAHARRLLEQSQWRRRARAGLLAEAALEVAAEAGDWEAGPRLLEEARGCSAEGGLRALPAAADAFEGLMLRAQGDLGAAIEVLERAVSAFDRLEAAWDAARFRLALAETLDEAGFDDRAAAELERCLPVLEGLRARRELDAARDLAADLADRRR